ncbi:hypothetical protein BU24DRAFT_418091 [Aaosphaeria arxii CBS 175.79]|uniref:Uncharacterized protein n=1 Tax=Aaosphaeria arxii CBS 175.79 TaxID=1450172 RepID=A0A6A5Y189_9PLEO|nr:uncharacterized protein BU24DRAFT_418091 [Aaosphaeria arxii CBS 175.79]KAF2018570.1 hypothetical protein BU24DRAFT_418091 [Aaosphaeria arxii CBS 175.79]
MVDIQKDTGPHSKCHFSHSLLPTYIDPHNVSTKKKPFSTFNSIPFSHTLDLVLPSEIYSLIQDKLENDMATKIQYARVHMKLGEILQGDFFTEYIKQGNIMMLSEGRSHVDNVIFLYEGVLRLELDRPTYERCGLQGVSIEDGGRKHQKARWVVEYDLRQPSMVHGKKGFGRLEWACKNVLDQSLTWLFYNFSPTSRESLKAEQEPIKAFAPFIKEAKMEKDMLENSLIPDLRVGDLEDLCAREQDDALDLLELLGLIALESPRILATDHTDAFISRYESPTLHRPLVKKDLVHVRFRGFIPPQFVRELFLLIRSGGLKVPRQDHDGAGGTASEEENRWFSLSANGFGGQRSYTVMQWAGRETLCWEIEQ